MSNRVNRVHQSIMSSQPSPYLTSSHPLRALDVRIVRGANAFAWSPVVRLTLDLGEYDEVFTNTIEGFFDALKALLPSLYDHHCSLGVPGGFFQRMHEGTLLGHVLEHIALELQVLAGMDVTYGKTRSTRQKGVYNVVFSYLYEEAGIFAAKTALHIVNGLLLKENIEIAPIVEHLRSIAKPFVPEFTTQELLAEARRRRIPVTRLQESDVESFWLGTGKYSRHFEQGQLIPSLLQASRDKSLQARENLNDLEQDIIRACIRALHLPFAASIHAPSGDIPTNSYRILLLSGTAPSVLKLAPPIVEGNGESSIDALMESTNRQRKTSGRLQPIVYDDETATLLTEQGFTRDSVIPKGIVVRLKREGTPENGGAVIEMNDEVCNENKELFVQIAEFIRTKFGYEMAELLIHTPSLHRPLADNIAMQFSANTPTSTISCVLQPNTRLYRLPTSGRTFNTAQHLLSTIFPANRPSRVPIVSITGGFGAEFLRTMLDDALTELGFTVGSASPQSASIRREPIPLRAHNGILTILTESDIDCAVLEIPLETITQEGLRYDRADVGVVLNIAPEDSDEYNDDTLERSEDAAHAHALVAEFLIQGGTAIINANNPVITRSVERYDHEMIFFATNRSNPHLALHSSRGGKTLLLENKIMTLFEGKHGIPFLRNIELETTLDKELLLALTATLLALDIPSGKVQEWLQNTLERLFTADINHE